MACMESGGEAIPENVKRIDTPTDALPSRSAELVFALAIWGALSPEQQESVRHTVRVMAYGRKASECVVQLHNVGGTEMSLLEQLAGDERRSDWEERCATYEMAALDNLDEWLDDKEGEFLSDAHTHALMSLFRHPAPDVAALGYKLQVFRNEDAHELYAAPEIIDLMISDARRLAVKAQ